MAKSRNIKVILVTPSPDQRIDIADPANPLEPYAAQIRELAMKHQTGMADPYAKFRQIVKEGKLTDVMSSVNHPNQAGHMIIVDAIKPYFY